MIKDVCSGSLTWGEVLNESSEVFSELIEVCDEKIDAIILNKNDNVATSKETSFKRKNSSQN